MGWVDLKYSKTKVKEAGKTLRKARLEPLTVTEADEAVALEILENWRAAHSFALNGAQMGLRSRIRTIEAEGFVSQRLKRRPTIINKLCRQSNMQLTTMQDIAGCRAVLEDAGTARALTRQWEKTAKNKIRERYDYVAKPASSGYRGIHLVVIYDERLVEVQIRSRLQHAWATAVENYGARLGVDLKSGEGPEEVLMFFQLVSRAMAHQESGEDVPAALRNKILASSEELDIILGNS